MSPISKAVSQRFWEQFLKIYIMKKMLGLFTAFMLIGTLSFAQETAKSTTCTPSPDCTPTPACAAAMGISLEKCKQICGAKKGTSTAATNSEEDVKTQLVSQKTNVAPNASAKSCNPKSCDPKACAKACGMTVAECQKVCGSKMGSTQKAADVKLVSQKVKSGKKCCKVKCCKKSKVSSMATASN